MIEFLIYWAITGLVLAGILDLNDVRKGVNLTLQGLVASIAIGAIAGPLLLIVLYGELKDVVVIKGRGQ